MSKHEEVATIGMWERIKTWLGLQDSEFARKSGRCAGRRKAMQILLAQ